MSLMPSLAWGEMGVAALARIAEAGPEMVKGATFCLWLSLSLKCTLL